jgi:hypothetical protein
MGLEYEFRRGGYLGINFHGKLVMIRVCHIGIDESHFSQIIKSTGYRKELKMIKNMISKLTQNNKDCVIMTSIDTYHPISGIK